MTSQLKTFMLLALLSGLIIVLGGALGGKTGIVIAFGLALIMNVGSYWYSDKIVLRMYQARELSESEAPMIYSMVRELAANAQIPMPRIAVVPEEAPTPSPRAATPKTAWSPSRKASCACCPRKSSRACLLMKSRTSPTATS